MIRQRVEKAIGTLVTEGRIDFHEGLAVVACLDAIGRNPELLNEVEYGTLVVEQMKEYGEQREEQS